MRFNKESGTPTDFSLNISPWCQTLSKALGRWVYWGCVFWGEWPSGLRR